MYIHSFIHPPIHPRMKSNNFEEEGCCWRLVGISVVSLLSSNWYCEKKVLKSLLYPGLSFTCRFPLSFLFLLDPCKQTAGIWCWCSGVGDSKNSSSPDHILKQQLRVSWALFSLPVHKLILGWIVPGSDLLLKWMETFNEEMKLSSFLRLQF